MKKSTSIRAKIARMTLLVSLTGLLLVSGISIISMLSMRRGIEIQGGELGATAAKSSVTALEREVKQQLQSLSKGIAALSDEKLRAIENQTRMVANMAEDIYSNPQKYTGNRFQADYLQPEQVGKFALHIKTASGISKQSIQQELDLVSNLVPLLCQVNEVDLNINASYIGSPSGFQLSADRDPQGPMNKSYEVVQRAWYKGAVAAQGIYWTDPFVDISANRVSINCSIPYYADDELKGVAVSAATLDVIKNIISTAGVGETGRSFIVDQNANIIITGDQMTVENGKVVYTNLSQNGDTESTACAADLLEGKSGIRRAVFDGREVFMAYTPLTIMPWGMVTLVDVDEVLRPSNEISKNIFGLTTEMVSRLSDSISQTVLLFLGVLLLMAVLTVLFSRRFAFRLSSPLIRLTQTVKMLTLGIFDYKHDIVKTGDEIQSLSEGFERMAASLQKYIANLTAVTAEKERIGAELGVATHIQASMLPCIFPAFPGRAEFDIYASMQPAKEVGGDFYDFFLVDDNHLAMVMADVSGKGVPAALFMVIAKTLIKNIAQTGLGPKEVLEKANNQLCENNEAEMFVTVWLGILEISTGKMICANAGHEFPSVQRANGDFELIRDKHGFVLAGMEGSKYREYELTLEKGDRLFVYTDGVAEATNAADELYGTDRMIDALNRNKDTSCEVLLHRMKEDIDLFVGEAPQFDDITMLSLEMRRNPE